MKKRKRVALAFKLITHMSTINLCKHIKNKNLRQKFIF